MPLPTLAATSTPVMSFSACFLTYREAAGSRRSSAGHTPPLTTARLKTECCSLLMLSSHGSESAGVTSVASSPLHCTMDSELQLEAKAVCSSALSCCDADWQCEQDAENSRLQCAADSRAGTPEPEARRAADRDTKEAKEPSAAAEAAQQHSR